MIEQIRRLLAAADGAPASILSAGAPVLRAPAGAWPQELAALPEVVADLAQAMIATMQAAPGVGLAAPQVGLSLPLVVMADPGVADERIAAERRRSPFAPVTLIEPAYEPVGSERVGFYEGCLSMPEYVAVRSRWLRVRLTARTLSGQSVDEVVEGWRARIVQHECDHLRGELYIDGAQPRSLVHLGSPWAPRWTGEPSPRDAAAALGFDLG